MIDERYYAELYKQFEDHLQDLTAAARKKAEKRLARIAEHTAIIFLLKLDSKPTARYEKLVAANIKGLQTHLVMMTEDKIKRIITDASAVIVKILKGVFLS